MKPETNITRAQVLEAITAKEGGAVFWWNYDGITQHELDAPPHYEYLYACEWHKAMGYEPDDVLKANALTAGKSIGELRELLSWAREEGGDEGYPSDMTEEGDK